MSWDSDPRIVTMLTAQAARAHSDGVLPVALSERIGAFSGEAACLGDDAAMFVRTAAMFGGASAAGVAGQVAWLSALAANAEVRRDVWTAHRGAVLYVLECVATVPAAWAWPAGVRAINVILALALRERAEAVPLRNGMSFIVVETFAEDLCAALAAAAEDGDGRLVDAVGRGAELLRCDWSVARTWAEGRRAALHAAGPAGLLGVPFETACPPPWAPGVEELARRFRRAASLDVNLYDSAPLTVAVCALALGERSALAVAAPLPPGSPRPPPATMLDSDGDWSAVTRQALDIWQGGRP